MRKEDLEVGMKIKHPAWNEIETVFKDKDGDLALEWEVGNRKYAVKVDNMNQQYPLSEYIVISKPVKEIRCTYCGKVLSPDEVSYEYIWVNRGEKRLPFCKGTDCAGFYQMGAEG